VQTYSKMPGGCVCLLFVDQHKLAVGGHGILQLTGEVRLFFVG
jgi:hypothetical protein